ncbi:group II intron reverse transcriptase/maturase [Amycolatopsis vastitatis]|uniref:RNA-directed DNA polymerase n=1 Tax=Amycolatopsis vastitatis TaxID=1905142 RepID=A0A229TCK9_9PSEU|nr:group II intron reverse transcriptase/maturase [Amycolatopsis vastitatis]OXM68644.1 group II intron reverse transcriptase/maturase [Amycolatopsis vastitatis]
MGSSGKAFDIPKMMVWEAYLKVRSNKGAAGVDRQSLVDFARDEKKNLYKIWNRMSSGSYFPPPVRAVEIPKAGGGVRVLGVPTVADRIAQTVVAMTLEPSAEQVFHQDSYGYRPARSALDAVETCRKRCWQSQWVIDIDIQGFFDNVPHEPILRAVGKHTDKPWVLLYVQRWLTAPVQQQDGTLVVRGRGTPQGSAISPLLSNLFMHYAFDDWLARMQPLVRFERYCDDVIVHCVSEKQALYIKRSIAERFTRLGLTLHPQKTKIVHCVQEQRTQDPRYGVEFTFLGFTFRPRYARLRDGRWKSGFLPAVSKAAKKSMAAVIRGWRLGRRTDLSFREVAAMINRIVAGWINYYGHFYKSLLISFLSDRINPHLVRWAMRKFKHLHRWPAKARRRIAQIATNYPGMFIHWRHGALPAGSTTGAV